jgi:hypothetical protein
MFYSIGLSDEEEFEISKFFVKVLASLMLPNVATSMDRIFLVSSIYAATSMLSRFSQDLKTINSSMLTMHNPFVLYLRYLLQALDVDSALRILYVNIIPPPQKTVI